MPRAIQIAATGGPEQLQLADVVVGDPGPGEIRIRHHACGLNFIDVYQRTGLYPLALPHGIGMEGAGIVEAVGEGVTHLRPGDSAAYASNSPGSYSEVRVMPAKTVCKLPDSIGFDTGAAMMLKGLTVQYLLKRTQPQGGLQAGDHVLWHAAAGGVGLIACQWARAMGLQLIATAGRDEKCKLGRSPSRFRAGREACRIPAAHGRLPHGRVLRRRFRASPRRRRGRVLRCCSAGLSANGKSSRTSTTVPHSVSGAA